MVFTLLAAAVALAGMAQAQPGGFIPTSDLATANGIFNIMLPAFLASGVPEFISPSAGDASFVIRNAGLLHAAEWDAVAPYHPTAVGIYTHFKRQPTPPKDDLTTVNTAYTYAAYRLLTWQFPEFAEFWRNMTTRMGLDPDDENDEPDNPVGIGNLAAANVIAARKDDGFNEVGLVGRELRPQPFRDYTGYVPVNTPYELKDPSRWQPDIQRQAWGIYKAQVYVTPQWQLVKPWAWEGEIPYFPAPTASDYKKNKKAYKAQVDAVLKATAALDDKTKMEAELFNNKGVSFGVGVFAKTSQGNTSTIDTVAATLITNMAAEDAGIAVWQSKRYYDAVRPFSAIKQVYGESDITAYGGLAAGGKTATFPANEYDSYVPVSDHPEYPSASACFCASLAEAMRLWFDTNELNAVFPAPAGSSIMEPGITPAEDLLLMWPTWDDFVTSCGDSRVNAGLHFPFAVEAAYKECPKYGVSAYKYMTALYDGTASKRAHPTGLPVSSIPKSVGPGGGKQSKSKRSKGKQCRGKKC